LGAPPTDLPGAPPFGDFLHVLVVEERRHGDALLGEDVIIVTPP
jgi:hypothetical protein